MGMFSDQELEDVIQKGWIIRDVKKYELGHVFFSLYDPNTRKYYDPSGGWVNHKPANRGLRYLSNRDVNIGNLVIFDFDDANKGSVYFFSLNTNKRKIEWKMNAFYTSDKDAASMNTRIGYYSMIQGRPVEVYKESMMNQIFANNTLEELQALISNKNQVEIMDECMLDTFLLSFGFEIYMKKFDIKRKKEEVFEMLNDKILNRRGFIDNILWCHKSLVNRPNSETGRALAALSEFNCYYALSDLITRKSLGSLKDEDFSNENIVKFFAHIPEYTFENIDLMTIEKMLHTVNHCKNDKEIREFAMKALRAYNDETIPFYKHINDSYWGVVKKQKGYEKMNKLRKEEITKRRVSK